MADFVTVRLGKLPLIAGSIGLGYVNTQRVLGSRYGTVLASSSGRLDTY